MVDPNATWADADLRDLIADYPLAWIVTRGAEPGASLLPLLLDLDPAGRPVSLTGHFPRSNPQFRQLQENPEALFLFLGPQGYLSPQGLKDKDWAPTWAFASVRIEATVTFDPALTDAAITRLVAHMEQGRPEPWTTAHMGPRYQRLREQVVGFRAEIGALAARFKLGQDEREEVFGELVQGLGGGDLPRWMRRFWGR